MAVAESEDRATLLLQELGSVVSVKNSSSDIASNNGLGGFRFNWTLWERQKCWALQWWYACASQSGSVNHEW